MSGPYTPHSSQIIFLEDKVSQLEETNSQLLSQRDELVKSLEQITYRLEKNRVWGGMEWKYQPVPSVLYLPLIEQAKVAIAKIKGE